MKKIWLIIISMGILSLFLCTSCSQAEQPKQEDISIGFQQKSDLLTTADETGEKISEIQSQSEPRPATLLYQGQASIRIVADEGKVIYIDPYAGDSYELAADLILVTHSHFDHNQIEKVETRNEDCQIITYREAIQNGVHQIFDLGYVKVEAVEAGYNSLHDVSQCVLLLCM